MTKTSIQMIGLESELLSDAIAFVEEDEAQRAENVRQDDLPRWKILVVDDDQDVHDVTRFILGDCHLIGRPVDLIEARSLMEAQQKLLNHSDIAVILLDVVMEEHDSGLKFARWVREAGLHDVRIILRTGQAGYAPELDVIRDHDINDYRSKADLTQTRLITSITTALRSFQQLQKAERISRGLESIIAACGQLYQHRQLASFAHGVLLQAASLFGLRGDGVVCIVADTEQGENARVISVAAASADYIGRSLAELPDSEPLKAAALGALAGSAPAGAEPLAVCVDTFSGWRFVICLACEHPLDGVDSALFRLFAANLAAGFENLCRTEQLGRESGR
jgi:CheY-like chemotaxis protein